MFTDLREELSTKNGRDKGLLLLFLTLLLPSMYMLLTDTVPRAGILLALSGQEPPWTLRVSLLASAFVSGYPLILGLIFLGFAATMLVLHRRWKGVGSPETSFFYRLENSRQTRLLLAACCALPSFFFMYAVCDAAWTVQKVLGAYLR